MTEWPVLELGAYPLEIIDGDRGAEYPKTADFTPSGYCLFLNAGNVTANGFAFDQCAYISEEKDKKLRKGRLLRNDTVATTRGTVGNFAFYDRSVPMSNIRINSGMVILRPDQRRVDPRFLYFAVRSPLFGSQIKSLTSGSAQPQLPIRDMKKLRLPLPPIQEQRSIVDAIGSLDDKIKLNRRMNETLEAMAQAIFRDWFVDFGPTRRKLEGATDPLTIMGGLVQDTERAQGLADLFPDALGDDGLPEGWREKELGTLVVLLKRGLTPSYCEGGIPVINQKCIRNGQVNFAVARRHDSMKRPPKERALQEEDVLVNSTGVGTLGRVATVRGLKEEATADSHVTICRADADRISKVVFSLFLEGQQPLIETMGHGSTGQTELSPSSLAALRIPVAPSQIQKAFDEIAAPLRSKVTANTEQSLALAATRDLLLPKLMSGEIRLSEAEGLMEAAQ